MGANPFAKKKPAMDAEDSTEGLEPKAKPGKPQLNRFGQIKKGSAPKGRYPRE